MRKECFLRLFLILLLLIILLSVSVSLNTEEKAYAQNQIPTEYEVKAAFIYNFAKFVEWPSNPSQSSVAVCVFGKDPFGSAFVPIEDKRVGDKKIIIKRNVSFQNLEDCNILFISNSEKERLPQILEALGGLPVLTIGDTTGFALHGVMINFYMEDKTVRFEINQEAAEHAGLKISSKLLKIARIVGAP